MEYAALIYLLVAFGVTVRGIVILDYAKSKPIAALVAVSMGLVWPITAVGSIVYGLQGHVPAKCAWCGKEVGAYVDKDVWREHYMSGQCGKHPLEEVIAILEKGPQE